MYMQHQYSTYSTMHVTSIIHHISAIQSAYRSFSIIDGWTRVILSGTFWNPGTQMGTVGEVRFKPISASHVPLHKLVELLGLAFPHVDQH